MEIKQVDLNDQQMVRSASKFNEQVWTHLLIFDREVYKFITPARIENITIPYCLTYSFDQTQILMWIKVYNQFDAEEVIQSGASLSSLHRQLVTCANYVVSFKKFQNYEHELVIYLKNRRYDTNNISRNEIEQLFRNQIVELTSPA